jgi:hypothetical protein
MSISVQRVDVWAAGIADKAGGLAAVLSGLRDVGADLDFIVARRSPEKPGMGVVFVAPLRGDKVIAAATNLGFDLTTSLHSIRVEGVNKAGLAAELTGKLAEAGINLRGLSAATTGDRFIMYLAIDSEADADKATAILRQA